MNFKGERNKGALRERGKREKERERKEKGKEKKTNR